MATQILNFEAQVSLWTRETEQRMTAVFRQATQETVSKIQSRIPVDTGFARASVRASLSEMPLIDPGAKAPAGAKGIPAPSEYVLTIAQAQLGQTIYIGWTAAYVIHLEYGHSKQAPAGFVGITAQEWPQIVLSVAARAEARAAANSAR